MSPMLSPNRIHRDVFDPTPGGVKVRLTNWDVHLVRDLLNQPIAIEKGKESENLMARAMLQDLRDKLNAAVESVLDAQRKSQK